MISTKHGFIFVHIQKTAGNSIQAALEDFADEPLVFQKSKGKVAHEDGRQGLHVFNEALGLYKHATAQEYRDALGDKFSEFFAFTSVRNPFDRVISKTAFKTGDIRRQLHPYELQFPEPLTDHLTVDGQLMVKNFIRFESIAADLARICQTLGITAKPLPHLNASMRKPSYRDYYTPETKAIVARRYAQDLDAFGYSF